MPKNFKGEKIMFPKGLIVSSQALSGNPMLDTEKLGAGSQALPLCFVPTRDRLGRMSLGFS